MTKQIVQIREGAGLTIRQLIEETYKLLAERNKHEEMVFPKDMQPSAEIADDSDLHRTRKGYMHYVSAGLFQFGGRTWAIGVGTASGGYPARPYNSDLLALEFVVDWESKEQLTEMLATEIRHSEYFANTLFFGKSDGLLAISKEGRFSNVVWERLAPVAEEYLVQKPEYDTRVVLASTLQHPTTKQTLYKSTFPEFLAKTIEDVLANPPKAT